MPTSNPPEPLFEIVDFYGCPFGEGKPSAEEEAFAAWIETAPTDGIKREFGPLRCRAIATDNAG